MMNRLGGAISARAARAYQRLLRRYREARAESRRLQLQLREMRERHELALEAIEDAAEQDRQQIERELNAEIAELHQEAAQRRQEYASELERLHVQIEDAETVKALQQERADNAEAVVQQLRAEIEIFKARDELWAQWEMRERARLEAETARLAAAKVRSLEAPHFDQET